MIEQELLRCGLILTLANAPGPSRRSMLSTSIVEEIESSSAPGAALSDDGLRIEIDVAHLPGSPQQVITTSAPAAGLRADAAAVPPAR